MPSDLIVSRLQAHIRSATPDEIVASRLNTFWQPCQPINTRTAESRTS